MSEYGLSLADLGGKPSPKPKSGGPTGKVAAKYRNSSTGESWSGRGPATTLAESGVGERQDDR